MARAKKEYRELTVRSSLSFESYRAGITEKDTFLQQKQIYEQMEERLKDKIRQQKEPWSGWKMRRMRCRMGVLPTRMKSGRIS